MQTSTWGCRAYYCAHSEKTNTVLKKDQLASQQSFTPHQQETQSLWLQAKSMPLVFLPFSLTFGMVGRKDMNITLSLYS